MTIEYIHRPFEVKAANDGGKFTGYASVFGDLDSYRDIVMPGAFKDSLASHKSKNRKVPILWQHRGSEPIGVYDVIDEDEKGLYVEGSLNQDVQQGREAYSLLKQGALSGISIGYSTELADWNDEKSIRYLKQVKLYEASLVTFPALDSARVDSVKSFEKISDFEALLRDAVGLSANEAKFFVSRFKSVVLGQRDVDLAAAEDAAKALRILRGQ